MNIFKRLFCNKWEKVEYIGKYSRYPVWLYKRKYSNDYKIMAIADEFGYKIYFDYKFYKLTGKIKYTHHF